MFKIILLFSLSLMAADEIANPCSVGHISIGWDKSSKTFKCKKVGSTGGGGTVVLNCSGHWEITNPGNCKDSGDIVYQVGAKYVNTEIFESGSTLANARVTCANAGFSGTTPLTMKCLESVPLCFEGATAKSDCESAHGSGECADSTYKKRSGNISGNGVPCSGNDSCLEDEGWCGTHGTVYNNHVCGCDSGLEEMAGRYQCMGRWCKK